MVPEMLENVKKYPVLLFYWNAWTSCHVIKCLNYRKRRQNVRVEFKVGGYFISCPSETFLIYVSVCLSSLKTVKDSAGKLWTLTDAN